MGRVTPKISFQRAAKQFLQVKVRHVYLRVKNSPEPLSEKSGFSLLLVDSDAFGTLQPTSMVVLF